MIIMPIKQSNLNFGAGKSVLFSDFDGTLLPQSLHDVYNGNTEQKKNAIEGFNKYFSQIQDFSNNSKDNFEIIITTGRRLNKNDKEGFLPTYTRIRQEGINLPKIKEIITSDGGDIFAFSTNGDVNQTIKSEKTALMKKLTGWDNELISKTINEISQKLGTTYEFVDDRGSYKLSLKLSDKSKTENFVQELQNSLKDKIQCRIKSSEVKLDDYNKTQGIKLYPIIDERKLNKSFDVKVALEEAIKNDDFVIAAGDASNDKEMLNIFNYVKKPQNFNIPYKAEEITEAYLSHTKAEIDKLPLRLLFIKPNSQEKCVKKMELYKFMQKQAELFPDKVVIVDETKLFGENNFLNAIKTAINNYAEKNSVFKNAWNGITTNGGDIKPEKFGLKTMGITFGVMALGMIIYKKFFHKNNQATLDNKEKNNII